jgi:pimeloyl-ACP methyl ester carboxylesterase
MSPVREQVMMLGSRKSMLGILSQCGAAGAQTDRPVVVILNAGVVHRIGPSRLHVLLARKLAGLGYRALRFDLSGIGDSDRRTDALEPMQAALADIREVLDSLEVTLKSRRAALVGICSGADHAVIYAGSDPRVVGTVLIDPHIPRTRQYYLHYYGRRLFRLRSWLNVMLGRHPMWGRQREDIGEDTRPDSDAIKELGSQKVRSFLELAYGAAIARRNRMLAVFTGGVEAQHCYREQLLDAFPALQFGDSLQLEYFQHADHLFQSEVERQRLIDLIGGWLEKSEPALEPAPAIA